MKTILEVLKELGESLERINTPEDLLEELISNKTAAKVTLDALAEPVKNIVVARHLCEDSALRKDWLLAMGVVCQLFRENKILIKEEIK